MKNSVLENWHELLAQERISQSLKAGEKPMIIGLPECAKALAVADLFQESSGALLVLVPNQDEVGVWRQNLTALLPEEKVLVFPKLALLPFDVCAHNVEVSAARLQVMSALAKGEKVLVVAPADAIVRKLVPKEVFEKSHFSLAAGDETEIGSLTAKLVDMGYTREKMVDVSGTFAARGEIVDIFPVGADRPLRIEFFDTEIENIRYFDPASQRSEESYQGLLPVIPVREIPLTDAVINRALMSLQKEFKDTLKRLEPNARKNLRGKINPYLEYMEERLWQDGMDHFFYHFYPKAASLLDYLQDNALVCLDESQKICQTLEDINDERYSYYDELLNSGQILPGFADNFWEAGQLVSQINSCRNLSFTVLPAKSKIEYNQQLRFGMRFVTGYVGQMELFAEDMLVWQRQGYSIFFCASSGVRAENIRRLLREHDIASARVGVLPLSQGLEFPDGKLVIITEKELLGKAAKSKHRHQKAKNKNGFDAFVELKPGDLVVHENHGIGRFQGIERITVDSVARDYLHIDYAGNDKLFVPVDQMDLVQKYIGNEGAVPKLYKLGGSQWNKVKHRVRASVADMADELLKLYAAREQAEGFAFSADNNWMREFEDAFEYEETEGQLEAIRDIKKDMESKRPMDRLLCGDVGYGKTEVAMRAAFKAVCDGKQVAMLVPTTLLAEQHYHTFKERFRNYPMVIEAVSRFVPKKKQTEILEKSAAGTLDILIGTHRLLSKDIAFKDLGLLIIDEEQRFGVAHKEKIKKWRNSVDVLTLSATPIPRTLHMSLVGMRDMSVITTPPEDREPVQTYVVEYNYRLVKNAIEKELSRGGQVYFIHNRVHDIDKTQREVQSMVPDAEVLVAHGQMTERQLEKVMTAFIEGEGDVLVCTTIAESGLDIPNVNTLIVKDADYFGLSQLYQLRGRVGRSPRQAYAYFTFGSNKMINDDAKKRLTAIRDFTELGSGFKIAMRDMEIRGAGNILGPEQHGHIAAVGFEMYCKMVTEEVEAGLNNERREAPQEREALQMDLGINAYIPDSYLSDSEVKIEVYKRIAALVDREAKEKLMAEVADRFGKMPQSVENLFALGEIKSLAGRLLVRSITCTPAGLNIRYFADYKIAGSTLVKIAEKYGRIVKFNQKKGFAMILTVSNLPDKAKLEILTNFLQDILAMQGEK
ncbi:MAG: transcription-repair coupling factor [Bacillota bacterium]|jgi:transcription-repair coupling factor (superfamily II helicase)